MFFDLHNFIPLSQVVEKLSLQVKNTTFALLEPDSAKRLKVEELINGEWFAMDQRLKQLTTQEKNALQQAQQAMSIILERGAKSARQQSLRSDGRAGSRLASQKVQTAVNNAEAGHSQVTVIKSNEPTIDTSRMETIYQSDEIINTLEGSEQREGSKSK